MSQLVQNQKFSEELQKYIINGGIVNCEEFHAGPCIIHALKVFATICNNSYKYYIPIYLIPLLLFQRKKLRQNPLSVIKRVILEFCGSVIFVGSYVAAYRYVFCKLRTWKLNNVISISFAGCLSGIFMFCEKASRRMEITLFTGSMVIETFWKLLDKRGLVTKIDDWEFLIFGFAMGIINYYYINHPNQIKYSYLQVFKKLWD